MAMPPPQPNRSGAPARADSLVAAVTAVGALSLVVRWRWVVQVVLFEKKVVVDGLLYKG